MSTIIPPTATAEDLVQAALRLPEADRLEIVRRVHESVVPPGVLVEGAPGFFEELDRRSAALESGEDPGVDAFDAIDRIEKELDEKNRR